MITITIQEAIKSNVKFYFTGINCINGHIAERLVSNRSCVECSKSRRKEWEIKNKSYALQKARENSKLNRKNNKEKVNASRRLWASKNREKDNLYYAKWRLNNKGHKNALTRQRQAAKLQRTPAWLSDFDKLKIQCIYSIAAMLTRTNKEPWHVDHVIPLQGVFVSGLHVPTNLQVMRGVENISKKNKFEVNYA
jgi:hypothetical protein